MTQQTTLTKKKASALKLSALYVAVRKPYPNGYAVKPKDEEKLDKILKELANALWEESNKGATHEKINHLSRILVFLPINIFYNDGKKFRAYLQEAITDAKVREVVDQLFEETIRPTCKKFKSLTVNRNLNAFGEKSVHAVEHKGKTLRKTKISVLNIQDTVNNKPTPAYALDIETGKYDEAIKELLLDPTKLAHLDCDKAYLKLIYNRATYLYQAQSLFSFDKQLSTINPLLVMLATFQERTNNLNQFDGV